MSSSSRAQHSATGLDTLVTACQRERSAYYATGSGDSPACMALFQRAFGGDQAAWAAIYTLFDSQLRAWVGQQQQVEPDDVIQDAWRGFAHTAPQRPHLLATDDLGPLLEALYRRDCPDVTTLVRYQERQLVSAHQLVVRQHLAACPVCQEEIALLTAIDQAPLPAAQRVRRVIEAIFQPPQRLAAPLRGDMLHYQTPQIAIVLSTRQATGQAIRWSLRGEARTPAGVRACGVLEAVFLRSLRPDDSSEQRGSVADNGTFAFQQLAPGRYSLHLLTADEEVVIRQVIVGDVDEER